MANTRHRRRNNGKRKQRSRRMRKRGGTTDDESEYERIDDDGVSYYVKVKRDRATNSTAAKARAPQATASQATAPQAHATQHYDDVGYHANTLARQQAPAHQAAKKAKKLSPGDVGYDSDYDSDNPEVFMGDDAKRKYEKYEKKRNRRRTIKPNGK
jgi:hypothetical protein